MDEDRFNMSIRKFLKAVGVTSQREIETAVRDALNGRARKDPARPRPGDRQHGDDSADRGGMARRERRPAGTAVKRREPEGAVRDEGRVVVGPGLWPSPTEAVFELILQRRRND